MSTPVPITSDILEERLKGAFFGSKQEIRFFIETLLRSTVFVPERYQAQPLTNSPVYPNDFLNILGVQDGERIVVPAFTRKELIREWCGEDLRSRNIMGLELFALIPEGWWMVLNPGREVEKEFSPWEIGELRRGVEAIPTVIEEIFSEDLIETLDVKPIQESEYPALYFALGEVGAAYPEVTRIHALKQEGKDTKGELGAKLLIGIEAPGISSQAADELKQSFERSLAPCQIGNDPLQIIVCHNLASDPTLGLFKNTPTIYQKPSTKNKICAFLSASLRRLRAKDRRALKKG